MQCHVVRYILESTGSSSSRITRVSQDEKPILGKRVLNGCFHPSAVNFLFEAPPTAEFEGFTSGLWQWVRYNWYASICGLVHV